VVRVGIAALLLALLAWGAAEGQVAITSPPDGATLRGSATVKTTVPNPGQGGVVYRVLDAQNAEKLKTNLGSPYELHWDTRQRDKEGNRLYSDGEYTIEAKAVDVEGNALGQAVVKVKVQNEITAEEAAAGMDLGWRLERGWTARYKGAGKTQFEMDPFDEAGAAYIHMLNATVDITWDEKALTGGGTGGADVAKTVTRGTVIHHGFAQKGGAMGGMGGGMMAGQMAGGQAAGEGGTDWEEFGFKKKEEQPAARGGGMAGGMMGGEMMPGGMMPGAGMMGGGMMGGMGGQQTQLETKVKDVKGARTRVVLRVSRDGYVELKKRKHKHIPLVENFITFPDHPVKVGESWTGPIALVPCVASGERRPPKAEPQTENLQKRKRYLGDVLQAQHTLETLEMFGRWKCACIRTDFAEEGVSLKVSAEQLPATSSYTLRRYTYFAYEEGVIVGMEDVIVHDLKIDLSETQGTMGGGMLAGGMMGPEAGMMGGDPAMMMAGGMPGAMGGGMPGMMGSGMAGGMAGGMGQQQLEEITGKYTVTYNVARVPD
jgi:hypothetical protein